MCVAKLYPNNIISDPRPFGRRDLKAKPSNRQLRTNRSRLRRLWGRDRLARRRRLVRATLHYERQVPGRHDFRDIAEDRVRDARRRVVRLQGDPGDNRDVARGKIISGSVISWQPAGVGVPPGAAADAETEGEVALAGRDAVQPLPLRVRVVRLSRDVQGNPALHVIKIGDDLARRAHQRDRNRVADIVPVAVLAERVTMGPWIRHRLGRRVARLGQTKGLQKAGADLVADVVLGDGLNDQAEYQVIRVAVIVFGPGREQGLLLHGPADQRARIEFRLAGDVHRLEFGRVVGLEQPTAHLAQLAHRDVLSIRDRHAEVELAQRIVEAEFSLIDKLEQHANDECFGVAADAEMICGRHLLMGRQIGGSEAAYVAFARVVPHADQHARNRRIAAIDLALFRHRRIDGAAHRRALPRYLGRPGRAGHAEAGYGARNNCSGSNASDACHGRFLYVWARPDFEGGRTRPIGMTG